MARNSSVSRAEIWEAIRSGSLWRGWLETEEKAPVEHDAWVIAAPFVVFINGVEQLEGKDYEVRDGGIVFSRPIIKEKIGTSRWLAMYLGLWGTYRKNETVDLQFVRDGKTELESDLAVISE